MSWTREIIERNNLDLGLPIVETSGKDNKFPDMEIYSSRRSEDCLCLFEAKRPNFDVFDHEENLKEPARQKATRRNAKYFVLLNFRKLVWFDTAKVNQMLPEEQQIINTYTLSDLTTLDELEPTRNRERIKKNLEEFLVKLYNVHTGKEAEPQIPVDELLINKLQEKINLLTHYYSQIIEDKCGEDAEFLKRLAKWFFDQSWNFAGGFDDFEKAARQASYLLVNKILFYDSLQTKRPNDLDKLEIPNSLTKGAILQTHLQTYFNEALKIDYENVFNVDFVDELAFPDSKEVIEEIKKLVALLSRYNLAELGFDIIGRIFERLIPGEERHNFGQYFTSADVVDLILKFCLKHENDITLDPSCGAGTFLVRAYQHKKLMNKRRTHEEILDTIWGNDIAKFPASLSIINLAINDLAVDRNYPNVIQEDFFNIKTGADGIDLEAWRTSVALTLSGKERNLVYPKQFDAIVGNPPYTRQEEIAELALEDVEYKENLIEGAVKIGGKKIADLSKRAGIHAFFFVHGWKFLREGGKFGFIVSNSWLDTDYGRGLQEFFLKNYKIVAIIESKIERWFAEADVNTCIVILEKCSNQEERDKNPARFVYLKKPLRSFIPPTSDKKGEEVKRQHAIEDFCDTVLNHRKIYENDDFRIYPILQSELYEEGFDAEEKKYIGAKWGKYLRAPDIFFEILRKCKDKLVPLKTLAKVRFGIKTGANEFFYLTEAEINRKEIEKEFWHHKNENGKKITNKILLKAQEVSKPTIEPEKLKNLVLFIKGKREKLDQKNIGKYIAKGESEENAFNKRPTCASREPKRSWFDLGNDIADLIAFPQRFRQRHIVFQNPKRVSINKNLYGIEPKNKEFAEIITLVLNSTLIAFWLEIIARQPGGGGAPLDVDVYVAAKLLIPKLEDLQKHKEAIEKIGLLERDTLTIFQELGANSPEEVAFEKVKTDRLELDKIVLQDILGLSEKEHLAVYRAVIDLVKSRLEKAKSVGKKSKKNGGSLGIALAENLLDDFQNGHE